MVTWASTAAKSDVVPFWECDAEGIQEEGMYLLASELDLPNSEALLEGLPVAMAAASYRELGMAKEALALHCVLERFAISPDDSDGLEARYGAEPNPFKEDWDRIPYVVRALCAGAASYFYDPD